MPDLKMPYQKNQNVFPADQADFPRNDVKLTFNTVT